MSDADDDEEDEDTLADDDEEDEDTLSEVACATCGIVFGIPMAYEKHRRNDQKQFVCPNGHSLGFYVGQKDRLDLQAEVDRLTKEVAELKLANIRLEAKLDQAEARTRTEEQKD